MTGSVCASVASGPRAANSYGIVGSGIEDCGSEITYVLASSVQPPDGYESQRYLSGTLSASSKTDRASLSMFFQWLNQRLWSTSLGPTDPHP